MTNSLFSEEAKAQLNALKKQLKPQPTDRKDSQSKPDQKVVLPSKANIQKQLKRLNEEKRRLEAELNQNTNDNSSNAPNNQSNSESNNKPNTDITEDQLLFEQAMAGTIPLKSKNQINPEVLRKQNSQSKKTDSQALAKRAAALGEAETEQAALSDMQALLNPVAENAFLLYKTPTLPNNIFTKLKEGKFRWHEAVDLHGSTIEEARAAVLQVIQITKDNQQSVLKIVHGKGKEAVLKTCVNGWLRQHEDVLAFVSAPAKDGGTGAVLVMLKRS